MSPQIESFVNSRKIAVVGFSRSGKKFGNMAPPVTSIHRFHRTIKSIFGGL